MRNILILQLSTALVAFFVFPAFAQDNIPENLSLTQQVIYDDLKNKTNNLYVSWDATSGVPTWIRMKNSQFELRSNDAVSEAYDFLEQYKDLYKIVDPQRELIPISTEKDELGMTHITFQQRHNGIDVYAAQLQFHFRPDQTISSIDGTFVPINENFKKEKIFSKTKIQKIATDHFKQKVQAKNLGIENIKSGPSHLYIYNLGLFSDESEQSFLVWRTSIYSEQYGINRLYYINALDGSIVKELDNIFKAEDRETYVLSDCWDATGTLTYIEAGLVGIYDAQAETAHQYADVIYDYYYDTFGQDSYDNVGATLESYTHYSLQTDFYPLCSDYDNAAWEPDLRIIRYGEDFLSLDIAGHEMTHGVIQYAVGSTASDTLEYENESGALNESYADIFGELVEFYNGGGDWMMGTDLPSGPSRDISNPNNSSYWQPSNVGEMLTLADGASAECDENSPEYNDCGYIHYNSGIPNNAVYLLVEGGTNAYSGQTVTGGVPREAAQKIYYRALTTYLSTNSNFSDAYNATMQACLDLNASDSTMYPLSYCESVFDAFAAVGINTDTSYAWANISASATSGTAPVTITFDGTGSTAINSSITNYTWDFGDGSTSSSSTTSHTYSNPGTYTITLTVTDSNGYTSHASTTITVYANGNITSDTTWSAEYSPYVIYGGLTVASGYTLTIDQGVIVKFSLGNSLTVNGTLDAQGTVTNEIVFTSYKDDDYGGDTNGDSDSTTPAAGDWRRIYFSSSSTGILSYNYIEYGGEDGVTDYPMIDIESDNVIIQNSLISSSAHHNIEISASPTISTTTVSTAGTDDTGIYITSGSPTLDGDTFSYNDVGISIVGSGSPIVSSSNFDHNDFGISVLSNAAITSITNNTFTNNTYPMWLSYLTEGAILNGNSGSTNTYNGIVIDSTNGNVSLSNENDLIYLTSFPDVRSGDTLTIGPGVVIKFLYTSSWFNINGVLVTEGTVDDPVVFTSIYDDTYGGDTNNDGSVTLPSAGDWDRMEFNTSSTVTFSNTIVQYGGGSSYGMLLVQSDAVTLADSYFAHSDNNSIEISGVEPTITNSIITGVRDAGIYVESSHLTLEENTVSDSTFGIFIDNSSYPTLLSNTITSNDYGVYVDSSTATMQYNGISSNTTYGLYSTNPTATIAAENNWWGDASGPYHPTTNPTGLGDAVWASADYEPWLTVDPAFTDVVPPDNVTLSTIRKDVWAKTVTLNWTNPTDTDFDHVQIDRTDVTAGTTTTLTSTETGTSYIDSTPAYSTTYTYTLYAVDSSWNTSSGVITTSQRLRNPTPTGLTLTAGDTTITATWNASSAPTASLGGYKAYYGTTRAALTNVVDVGNVITTTLTGLTNGTRYFVAVTAYNKGGTESSLSQIQVARPHL